MRSLLVLLLLALTAAPLRAQNRPEARGVLIPDAAEPTTTTPTARVSDRTGFPVALYYSDYEAAGSTPEELAWDFLGARGDQLGIKALGTLAHASTRRMLSGYRVRFTQSVSGIPVYKGGVAVSLSQDGAIHFVANDYKPGLKLLAVAGKRGPEDAIRAATEHVSFQGAPRYQRSELVVYAGGNSARLAHNVALITSKGEWDILVDAVSGEVFRAEPTGHMTMPMAAAPYSAPSVEPEFSKPPMPRPASTPLTARRVDGTAMVFDPDPPSAMASDYGAPGLVDGGDADTPELTAARRAVTLRDISFDGTNHSLVGPWAEIIDIGPPFQGLFEQAGSDFDFTRSNPAFEAANIYYHVDQSMRYINETLGISLRPLQYSGGVQFDPHAENDDVNAHYFLNTGHIQFGDGGADLAEDQAVVLHELGHGLHHWITDLNSSRAGGLGEGSGDYWAASYQRSLGIWAAGDERRDYMNHWGGRPFFNPRRTDYAGRYPLDLTGAIHTDGQMWSTALMSIWDKIGRETTDILFLEGLSMTGSGSDTDDAAVAVLKADSLLHGASHVEDLIQSFVEQGFVYRAVAAGQGRAGPGPLTVSFFDVSTLAAGSATSWSWDFETDGVNDAFVPFTTHTYRDPGLYSVTLTAADATRSISTTLTDYVSVNSGVYVWEGFGNPTGRSGAYIHERLQQMGVESYYSRTAQIHPSLEGFDAVFLSFGPFDPQALPTPLQDIPARVIREYIRGGGRVYLEGSDVFGSDQPSNTDLLEVFGIGSVVDGGVQPVTALRGQSGTLAGGMEFVSSGQTAVSSVDRFAPDASALALFDEDGYGVVGVQHEHASGGRAVVMSYTMADLEPNGASNRNALLANLLTYFEIDFVTDVDDESEVPVALDLKSVYPNPAADMAVVAFSTPFGSSVTVEVYDMLGRRVVRIEERGVPGSREIALDTSQLPAGTYIVRVAMEGTNSRKPLVVVR